MPREAGKRKGRISNVSYYFVYIYHIKIQKCISNFTILIFHEGNQSTFTLLRFHKKFHFLENKLSLYQLLYKCKNNAYCWIFSLPAIANGSEFSNFSGNQNSFGRRKRGKRNKQRERGREGDDDRERDTERERERERDTHRTWERGVLFLSFVCSLSLSVKFSFAHSPPSTSVLFWFFSVRCACGYACVCGERAHQRSYWAVRSTLEGA